MKKDAILDEAKIYRYMLKREWGSTGKFVNFIMLNPSTADAVVDDPTIRRCISLAQRWNFDGMYVTNLFAFRATDPLELKKANDPIGPENNAHIEKWADSSQLIVASWGNHGSLLERHKAVHKLLRGKKVHCLAVSKSGQPKHPLYIRSDTQPLDFSF